ncbi:MAG TPA: hypothetical protein VEJ63_02655 [Planctomycetota bacterium]|nr:hypothetical protein [Planctomycetota bacterium]
MFKPNLSAWFVCIFVALLSPLVSATEMSRAEFVTQVSSDSLPPYEFHISNPLVASATGYLKADPGKIENERRLGLHVPGFAKKLNVLSVIQNHPAPLVVVLPGISGIIDDKFSRVWPAWYAEAGYHVLSFDSCFAAKFNEVSRHGVSGNIWRETELVRDVIATYLKDSGVEGNVTGIGVVGMSYGGIQALILRKMESEGKLPFKLDAVQAYSPPVNLERSASILNQWLERDRRCYTQGDLQLMLLMKPGETDYPDSQLRAAIAESFRLGLAEVLVQNDARYCLKLLERGTEFDDKQVRYDAATKYKFLDFAYGVSYPYWQEKLGLPSLQPLIDAADVCNLVQTKPACTEIILANDDPLNSDSDIARLKECAGKNLTLLPNGGHLGYVNENWTRMKLLTLFECRSNGNGKAASR